MDKDVVELLLMLLDNTPVEVRGSELARLAEIYDRAATQVRDALVEGD